MAWKKSKKCSTSPSKHDTCCAPSISSATCNATLKNVFVAVAEVVLHRARQSEQLATICAEKAWRTSLLARGVGGRSDLQRNQRTLGENCFAGRAGGVLHYATQIAAIDAKSRTGFYLCNVARNKNRCIASLQVAEVPCYTAQFFSDMQRSGVARWNGTFGGCTGISPRTAHHEPQSWVKLLKRNNYLFSKLTISRQSSGDMQLTLLRLVYTYDASTSIIHVWTGTTQAQAQEKGARACACVVPVHTWIMLALVLLLASYV